MIPLEVNLLAILEYVSKAAADREPIETLGAEVVETGRTAVRWGLIQYVEPAGWILTDEGRYERDRLRALHDRSLLTFTERSMAAQRARSVWARLLDRFRRKSDAS